MCDLEDELKKLVSIAQQHPLQSAQRRKAIDHLYQKLRKSNKLSRPPVPPHIFRSYDEIYDTAIQQLFCYLYQNIEKYNPARGTVLTWVNYLLRIRFPDAIREVAEYKKGVERIPLDALSSGELLNSASNAQDVHPATLQPTSADVVEYLKTDPEGVFQRTHVQGHPQTTFQFVTLQRLEGYSWQDISSMCGIPVPTLSSFLQRNLKKFLPLFHAHLAC